MGGQLNALSPFLWHRAESAVERLATYASLQDLDAALQFDYAGNRDWSGNRLSSYFDLAQNPVQMASMTAAATAFLRGHLAPRRFRL